jgi:hypothetical protein
VADALRKTTAGGYGCFRKDDIDFHPAVQHP